MTVGLEAHLRARRADGAKLLVPYVSGGLPGWTDVLLAFADAGADAIEIGIPFSDPVMDGPTIQEASQRALDAGATPQSILSELRDIEAGVPLVAMTYANLAHKAGWERFATDLARGGISGAILPDLPLEESGAWEAAAAGAGVDTVLLAAPVSPDDRLRRICQRSRGFVYGVTVMGVTGARSEMTTAAAVLGDRLKAATDLPVLMGFGVSSPEHAVELSRHADGVIIASALMRRFLDGEKPNEVADLVAEIRAALDAATGPTARDG
ncbi:MAG: tryptophan synthase subunit alpha [Acidimicrobiales bacterium]